MNKHIESFDSLPLTILIPSYHFVTHNKNLK